jgi:hypothetical protein
MMDETAVNDDDMDFDALKNIFDDGQEDQDEEKNDDLGLFNPEMDSAMDDDISDDKMDTFAADPMMMKYIRILIKKRIQAKMMCRNCSNCGRCQWKSRPMTTKRRWITRPIARPITRLPPRMKCFWKRVCY